MKKIKLLGVIMAVAVLFSLTACGSGQTESAYEAETDSQAAALLTAVSGTYEELFPVLLEKKYDSTWVEVCTSEVGSDNASAAVEKLKGSMSGEVIGQKAVDAYTSNPENMSFNCDFTGGVDAITFDGATISGSDEKGKQVFSHNYSYVGYDKESDFYEFKTEDSDAGEFTYFVLRGDTPFSTYHIEFRYGSDLDALLDFYKGDYAYWMAAGIIKNCDEEMAKNSINLFCTENLGESD